MKSAGDGPIIERGSPRLSDEELGREQQSAPHEQLVTQEAFSELGGEAQGTNLELGSVTLEALAGCKQEQQRKMDKEGHGPIPPVLRKFRGNIPPLLAELFTRELKEQRAMKSAEWSAWREAEETEMRGMIENSVYEQVVRSKDKLVFGTKMLYKRKVGGDGTVEKYSIALSLKDSGRWKGYITRKSTHPHQRPRRFG